MLLFRLVILSLAIHLVAAFLLQQIPTWSPLYQDDTIEIEVLENPPLIAAQKEKTVVRQTDLPEDQLNPDSKELAEYLSELRQRVKEQMQAAKSGKTRNREQQKAPTQKPNRQDVADSSDDITEEAPNVEQKDLINLPSTVGEYLPDSVQLGQVTALNTNRFTYYTFYSRVEDLFRFRWESNLRQVTDYLGGKQFKGRYKERWITRLKIILNSEGHYQRSVVVQSSGVDLIDRAAIEAFADARYFPNPPADLIRNGRVELDYQFVLKWKPHLWTQR